MVGMVILNYNDYENTIKMILQVRDYKNINKIGKCSWCQIVKTCRYRLKKSPPKFKGELLILFKFNL